MCKFYKWLQHFMLKNIDKRIRLTIGVLFIIGSLFGGLVGYDLRSVGQQYNHIWVLSIIALYAGFDWISKALNED
jgi:uncharacterized membrane protein YfcA